MLPVLFPQNPIQNVFNFFSLCNLIWDLGLTFFFKWRWFIWNLGGNKKHTKIPVEGKQRREPKMNVLSNQLSLWETGVHPMGVLGNSTEYNRGKPRKLGWYYHLPTVLGCLPAEGPFKDFREKSLTTLRSLALKDSF